MPYSKEYSQREMIIDRCLSGGRKYTGEQLMSLVNDELRSRGMQEITSRSTFAADINEINSKYFQQYHKDVIRRERHGRQFVYYYTIPGFSIYDRALSDKDISDIHKMVSTLRRFKGMPQFAWLDQLEVRFDMAVMNSQKPFVAFDDSYNENAMKPFAALLQAIDKHKVVEVEYRYFGNGEPSVNILSPYFLKQYGLRWYLLGSYPDKEKIYTFALDRIAGVKVRDDKEYRPTDTDFEHYFDDIIGVTDYENREVEHIELWASAKDLPYLITKPLHHTQKIVSQNEKGALLSIDAKWNYELEQTIFSYGEGLEIMKPVELRNKFKNRIEKLLSIYQTEVPG